MTPYVSPIYEVRSRDSELVLTMHYADDDPGVIQITSPDRVMPEVSIFVGAGELPALIDALRRIHRDARRDQAAAEVIRAYMEPG